MSQDRDLRERFHALRSEDRERAEPAARVLGRARARGDDAATHSSSVRPWRIWAPSAAVVALTILVWWTALGGEPNAAGGVGEPADSEWAELDLDALGSLRTPSDVLLEIQQPDLLGARPPELLRLPELQIPALAPQPVRESALTRRTLS